MKKSTLLFLLITLYSMINAQSNTSASEKTDKLQMEDSAKYLYVKGNFNTYATLNNTINGYSDGIITYIFDRKTKKLKSTRIEQYRIFRMPKPEWDPQKFASWDYSIYMHLPQIKRIEGTNPYKKTKNMVFHKMEGSQRDEIEIKEERLQEKELAILGVHVSDVKYSTRIAYTRNSRKQPEDLLQYNESSTMKLKYKKEQMYNVVNVYTNFYPTAFDSGDEKHEDEIKFDLNTSYYTSKYWENPSFPDMQNALASFLKEELKEKQNINSLFTKK